MPSVTQLADRVCSISGLSDTGSDRTLVLGYLNQAYAMTCLEAGSYTSTFTKTLTSGTADYTIGTAPLDVDDLVEIRGLWLTNGSVTDLPLRQVPEYQILRLRQATVPATTPQFYALRGTRKLLLYPAPGANTSISGSYLAEPPSLVESAPGAGEESTPTAIPSAFHYDLIGNRATALALEFDNRFDDASVYDAKWGAAMERLLAWVARFGGPTVTNVSDIGFEGPRDMDL